MILNVWVSRCCFIGFGSAQAQEPDMSAETRGDADPTEDVAWQ